MSLSSPASEQLEQVLRSACSELGRRIRAGESCSAEQYLARYPELAANPDLAIELIYTEYVVRLELNQHVSYDDWATRFPQWRSDLEQLIEVHEQVCGDVAAGSTFVPEQLNTRVTSDGVPLVTAETVRAGRRVGNYELIEEIGRGGMGVVYRARQVGLNRQVALKMVLSGDFASARELKRFQLEAEAAARLQHPNIVQIFEVGAHEGRPYFSMELMDGGRLDEVLSQSALPPRSAAELLNRLARAAHYAHQRGVVHRDLKPSNVLLAPSDRINGVALGATSDDLAYYEPKIADFGLAKQFFEGETKHTKSGAVIGTPSYMSPEQARGRSAEIGPASDTYSLGAILYESLTGRPPFLGNSPLETLRQVAGDEPVSPSRVQKKTPRDLVTICLKCLEKDPGRRYASALALADDLRRFLAHEPIHARPSGAVSYVAKWAKRRPTSAALVVLVIAIMLVAAPVFTWLWIQAEQRGKELAAALRSATRAREAEHAERDRAERILYFHKISASNGEWLAKNRSRAAELLDVTRPDLRNWEWRYLKGVCSPELRTLRHTDSVYRLVISPDGQRIAAATGQWWTDRPGEIKVWDVTTFQELFTLRGHDGPIFGLAFSPDSKTLASANVCFLGRTTESGVKFWDMETGDEKTLLNFPAKQTTCIAWSPDGKYIATGHWTTAVNLWSTETGELVRTLKGHKECVFSIAFTPDSQRLISGGRDHKVYIWPTEAGGTPLIITAPGDVRAVAASPDGRLVGASTFSSVVAIYDAASGAEVRLYRGHNAPVKTIRFRPDGQSVASSDDVGIVRVWNLHDGRDQLILSAHTGHAHDVQYHPDGRQLITAGADRAIRFWDSVVTKEVRDLGSMAHGDYVTSLAVSQTGRFLVSAASHPEVASRVARQGKVFDLDDGAKSKPIGLPQQFASCVSMSHDDSLVAVGHNDGTVAIYDPKTVSLLRVLGTSGSGSIQSVAFRPASDEFAAGAKDGTITFWHAGTGERLHSFDAGAEEMLRLKLSADGSLIATSHSNGEVHVRSVSDGKEVAVLRGHEGPVWGLAFTRDPSSAAILATGGDDSIIQLWDAAAFRRRSVQEHMPIKTLTGHYSKVWDLAFTPDDQRLASASQDRTARIWDVISGSQVLTLEPQPLPVTSLAFSGDSQLLASAAYTIGLWRADEPTADLAERRLRAYEQSLSRWHESESLACERIGNWPGLIVHGSALIDANRKNWSALNDRAYAYAELGDWEKAEHDWKVAIDIPGRKFTIPFWCAVLSLQQGDRAQYAAICERYAREHRDTMNGAIANMVAWCCALAPEAASSADVAVQLGRRAIAADPKNSGWMNTLAAALYRAGQFDEARTKLEEAMQLHGQGGYIEDWLLLAMVQFKLENFSEATEWMNKVDRWLELHPKQEETPNLAATNWSGRVCRKVLLDEAHLLFQGADKN